MKKVLVMVLLFIIATMGDAVAVYKIGILAKRGAPTCMKEWGATAAYLKEVTGEKFIIIPLKFVAIEPMVKAGKIDFMLANSAFYVEMEQKYNVRAIATLVNSREGKALKEFGGVLFVRRDSDIRRVSQIRGKRFMCVKYSSFGGGHMVWRLLLENGINPKTDLAAFLEGGKHDNVVLAVKNGTVDAGTVRSDTLERMHDEGKIKMSDFRIINRVKDRFPFVHSTRLYPEWPMAAMANTSRQLTNKVTSALRKMPSDSKAAQSAKIVGWTKALDYEPVKQCLKTIKYGVFGEEL